VNRHRRRPRAHGRYRRDSSAALSARWPEETRSVVAVVVVCILGLAAALVVPFLRGVDGDSAVATVERSGRTQDSPASTAMSSTPTDTPSGAVSSNAAAAPAAPAPAPAAAPAPSAEPAPLGPSSAAPPPPAPSTSSAPPASTSAPPSEPADASAASAEAEVLQLVNAERSKVGCAALAADGPLADLARAFSADMAERDFFSHTDPDGRDPWERAADAGISNLRAENIARGQQSAAAVMSAWMTSSGHRANILNCDYRTLGVGAHFAAGGPWWTQDFGV